MLRSSAHPPIYLIRRFSTALVLSLVFTGLASGVAGCDLFGGPGNRPPEATISSPPDGTRILEDETVTLIGHARDPENGSLDPAHLAWFSHLDGRIGDGDTTEVGGLVPGRHRISLVATDPDGTPDTASIHLRVGDQPEPIELPYRLEPVFEDLELARPVNLVSHPDGGRLYAGEQRGTVVTFPARETAESSRRVLDLRDRIYFEEPHAEEGILGLALDPNFGENGHLYVLSTRPGPEGGESYSRAPDRGVRTVLSRLTASSETRVDPSSETILLTIDQPGRYHNGGQLAFGPDGYLYASIGDGGTGGDPAQETGWLPGSILRIDPRGGPGARSYGIPPDNPFANSDGPDRPEIYAWGFRNVWRFGIDPATGTLWAGDVGHTRYEELSLVERGGNYGWNEREGAHCLDPADGCRTAGLTDPLHEYGHGWGASILGGHVYRGDRLPDLRETHVYADFVSGRVWALSFEGDTLLENRLVAQHPRPRSPAGQIAEITFTEEGRLYLAALDGSIYRLARN